MLVALLYELELVDEALEDWLLLELAIDGALELLTVVEEALLEAALLRVSWLAELAVPCELLPPALLRGGEIEAGCEVSDDVVLAGGCCEELELATLT